MTADARLAAAAALRDLNHAFVAHDADGALLDRIRALSDGLTAELHGAERRDRSSLLRSHVAALFAAEPSSERPAGPAYDPMTDRAVGGQTNPLSAELTMAYEDEEVVVRTVLGAAYEGAPGRAHGGMVAALFDDITGFVLPLAGTAAYTGEITVRYRRPVPVGAELEFRARIVGRDGRKLRISADCRAGTELLATADALFITVDITEFGTAAG